MLGSLSSNTAAFHPVLSHLSSLPKIAPGATTSLTRVSSQQQVLRAPPPDRCRGYPLALPTPEARPPSLSCMLPSPARNHPWLPTAPSPNSHLQPSRSRVPGPCLPPRPPSFSSSLGSRPPSPPPPRPFFAHAVFTPRMYFVPFYLATATQPGLYSASRRSPATPTPSSVT